LQNNTIIQAIALAKDLKFDANRTDILLIRDNGIKKEKIAINLTDSRILTSPYYYLKQNDIIYVKPNKRRILKENLVDFNLLVSVFSFTTSLFLITQTFK
jgi:polysaccharide export outer membrane protein